MKEKKGYRRCYCCGEALNEHNHYYKARACKDCERDRMLAYQFKKRAKELGLEWARKHVERSAKVVNILKAALEQIHKQ